MLLILLLSALLIAKKEDFSSCVTSKQLKTSTELKTLIKEVTSSKEYKHLNSTSNSISANYKNIPVKVVVLDMKNSHIRDHLKAELAIQSNIKNNLFLFTQMITCVQNGKNMYVVYNNWEDNFLKRYELIKSEAIDTKLRIMHKMAQSLDYLHNQRIVHGDVRFLHFYFSDKYSPQVILGDFYHSSLPNIQKEFDGTTHCRAPELNNKEKKAYQTIESDIWMLTLSYIGLFSEESYVYLWNSIASQDDKKQIKTEVYENFLKEVENKLITDEKIPNFVSKKILSWLSIQPENRPTALIIISDIENLLKQMGSYSNQVLRKNPLTGDNKNIKNIVTQSVLNQKRSNSSVLNSSTPKSLSNSSIDNSPMVYSINENPHTVKEYPKQMLNNQKISKSFDKEDIIISTAPPKQPLVTPSLEKKDSLKDEHMKVYDKVVMNNPLNPQRKPNFINISEMSKKKRKEKKFVPYSSKNNGPNSSLDTKSQPKTPPPSNNFGKNVAYDDDKLKKDNYNRFRASTNSYKTNLY